MRFIREIIKSPSFQTLGIFAGGNIFVAVIGGLGGLIQARWIAPEVFGEFRKFGILTVYLNIGLVLVHDGLSRQFPFLLGQGKKTAALQVAATAKWWYLLLCWAFSLLFAGLALTSVMRGDYRSSAGWGVQIPVVWIAIYGAYLGVMYRTSSEFKRLSYNNIISNVLGFGALVIVKVWGYWGLAVRLAFQSAVGLYINRHYVPVKVKAAFDAQKLVNLAKVSLPLAIPAYISTSCLSASLSLIVLKYCGQSGLGIYSVALAFQAVFMTFTSALYQMFITKLTYKYGETGDVSACLKFARRPTLLCVGATTIVALVVCLAIGPSIRLALPKYEAAIPIVRIFAVQMLLTAAALPMLIFQAALWYKSVSALTLTRVLVCLSAVAALPKTIEVIAACILLGDSATLIVGFGILRCRR